MCWTWKVPAGAADSLFWCSLLGCKPAHVRSQQRGFTLTSFSSSSSSLWDTRGQWKQSLTGINLTEGWRGWWECQTMHHHPHSAGLKLHGSHSCKGNHLNITEVLSSQKFPQEIVMRALQRMLPWEGTSNAALEPFSELEDEDKSLEVSFCA